MPEPHDSFNHARWKIERAKKHLWDFHEMSAAFVQANSHFISTERDPNTGKYILYVGPSHKAPTELSLIAGDAIHNARAALDHVWMGVIRHLDPSTKTKSTFPIDEEREALQRRLVRTEVCKAFPHVEGIILDGIRPYKTGNRDCWLFALNRLDNRDKHNMLVVSRASIHIRKAKFICPEVVPLPDHVGEFIDVRIHANKPMPLAEYSIDFPEGTGPRFESDPDVTASVAFDNGVEGVGLMAVEPALIKLVQAADEAIKLFIDCFPEDAMPSRSGSVVQRGVS